MEISSKYISTCEFSRHVYDCGINNNCLEEPFFSLNVMLRLNKSDRLETIENHFHLKGYDTIKFPVETNNQYN